MTSSSTPPTTPFEMTEARLLEYRDAFSIVDTEKTNYIQKAHLRTVMNALGKFPSDSELNDFLEQVESKDTDKLHFAQFLTLMMNYMTANPDADYDEIRDAFKVFDLEDKGYVVGSHLRHILTNLGERLSDREVDEMFYEIGANEETHINIDDFIKIMRSK
jgi:calmodulin